MSILKTGTLLPPMAPVLEPQIATPALLSQPQAAAVNQEPMIIYQTKERVSSAEEETELPQATGSIQAVKYNAHAIGTLLKVYGIGSRPESECYVYPPLTQAAATLLIRDNVEYFLHAQEKGQNRRVGILVALSDQHLAALVIELSGFQKKIARQISAILTSTSLDKADAIIQNEAAVVLFRQLYARVECSLLGLSQQDQTDRTIVKKLESLLTIAYAIPQISVNFISPDTHRSNVVLFEDLLRILKREVLEEFIPQNQNPMMLFRKHLQQSIDVLTQNVSAFATRSPALYQQIIEKALISFKYALLLQQISQFKTIATLIKKFSHLFNLSSKCFK